MSSRSELLQMGAQIADALDAECRRLGIGVFRLGAERLSGARALRSAIAHSVADSTDEERRPVVRRVREGLFSLREAMRIGVPTFASLGAGGHSAPDATAGNTILFVPREKNHFRDLVPVSERLTKGGWRVVWHLVNSGHQRLLPRGAEFRRIEESAATSSGQLAALLHHRARLLASTQQALAGCADARLESFTGVALNVLLKTFVAVARVVASVRRAVVELRPVLVVVGNPCTMEGRVAGTTARGYGVPVAAIQHGDLHSGDPLWRDAPFDRIFVWGSRGRDALRACDYPDAKLVITGAPWLDDAPQVRATGKTVLVATSGAGHTVGRDEHIAHVKRLEDAAARVPELTWVFRLHSKDDPSLYASLGRANVTITSARTSEKTLNEQLADVGVLITVTSTAALDAMLARVPVISLGRPPRAMRAAYVEMGATVEAPLNEDLAAIVRRVANEGAPASVERAAREYSSSFYGLLDGKATERVAEAMIALAGARRKVAA